MTPTVSTYSLMISSQRIMEGLQKDLADRQKELSTGRKADLSLDLGSQIRESMNKHILSRKLQNSISGNLIISTRIEASQTVLSEISSHAEEFKSSLIQAQNDMRGQNILGTQAKYFLKLFISSLNATNDNMYLFSGTKTNIQPINSYFSEPTSKAKSIIDSAYSSNPPGGFGFTQTSSLVSNITPNQLSDFINGSLSNCFSDSEWSLNWSNASDRPLKNLISPDNIIETSITNNDPALRKIAMAYVMMSDLGAEAMNPQTYQSLVRHATSVLDEGLKLLGMSRARVGVMQQAIQRVNQMMQNQNDHLNIQIARFEGIDQAEVAANINNLLSRIESSYTLTAKLSKLSLTKYL